MVNFFKRIWSAILNFFKKLKPGPVAWKGANKAILTTVLVIWMIAALVVFVIQPGTLFGLLMPPLGVLIAFLISAGVILGLKLLNALPEKLLWLLPGTYFLMNFVFGSGSLEWQFPLFVVLFSGAAGAGIYSLKKKNRKELTLVQKISAVAGVLIGMAGLIWGLVWLSDTGFEPMPDHINAAQKSSYRPEHISLPNPAEPGPYEVAYLTYGSGKDKQRPEYAEGATIVTDSVDGSRLLDNWEGFSGKLRTKYWGVDEKSLPINGRVWYPKGEGPFPLALIVHGNHGMHDYSDPGYEYLGRLLASHGIIMTSVDENFINSGWTDFFTDGLDEENDARGWLLLEHLKNWRSWNTAPGGIFSGKVDMDNLAVMGHSRGGEAAAIAGFFNKLPYYPDDAKQSFDFNFNIKAVVSIAPVDGQYKPGETGTPLNNVNYLVLHGANDGDVQSFAGLRQYERAQFTDSSYYFKSAVYIYGANHGQFNTTWGNRDSGFPYGSLLNVDALMPMEEQLTVGKTYISAFLQATLQGKAGYERLFQDYRSGADWLPETIYLNQYQSSDWQMLADFEEDLDLTTTSAHGKITTENLTVWREQLVNMKWGNRATRAVYIGWDSLAYEADTASFQIALAEPIDGSSTSYFTFELSESKEGTYPDKERDEELKKQAEGKDEENTGTEEEDKSTDSDESEEDADEEEEAPAPLDFSIELKDSSGTAARLKLSDYSYLQRQITVDVLKNPGLQSNKISEAVYNTFFIDLKALQESMPDFDIGAIISVKFIFDQNPKGVIILDKLAVH
jgi:dienelactone hydrolase